MKKLLLMFVLTMGLIVNASAQGWYSDSDVSSSHNASLTIMNRSSYSLTVKIMRTGERGLYQTISIAPQSSGYVTFSKSDTFFTKTKATKGRETLYKKSSPFSVQCDATGYSQGTLEFFVSSGRGGGRGGSGQGISKAEFDKDK